MTEPEKPSSSGHHYSETVRRLQSEKFSRYFLLTMLIGVVVLFLTMIRMFLIPIVLSTVITTLFFPFYNSILRGVRNRRSLASFLCCLILFIALLIPLFFIAQVVSGEAAQFYRSVDEKLQVWLADGSTGVLSRLQQYSWFQHLSLDRIDWQQTIRELLGKVGSFAALLISKTSGGALYFLAYVFITLFICFYFFRDGEHLLRRLRNLIPLDEEYIDALINRFVAVSRATIKGVAVIGFIQSAIGGITLWIFGVHAPLLWFFVMLILSFIPAVGAWLVMHPAAIIEVLMGHYWRGLGIFLVTVLIISSIDNVIRPRLVGQFSGLHDLIIFFAALGGLSMFGPLGVLVGPIVAAFFVTLLEIYSEVFRHHLERRV
jgi:predicted PurR-regulated permease PerM